MQESDDYKRGWEDALAAVGEAVGELGGGYKGGEIRALAPTTAISEKVAPQEINPKKKNVQKEKSDEVERLWETYDAFVIRPHGLRSRPMESAHRTMLGVALKVRTFDEIERAIHGLASSPHHKGQNDRRKKYLDLRYAVKGNSNSGESNGERIDKAGTWVQDPLSAILSGLSSEGRVILLREKKQVEQALRNPGEAVYVSRAEHAVAHLRQAWNLVASLSDGQIVWRVEP